MRRHKRLSRTLAASAEPLRPQFGGRGRPRKFGRPSRAITLTLPDDVIARLSRMDADVSRAIVKLVESRLREMPRAAPAVELARYGSRAVILVSPVGRLKALGGVELVPVVNGRALIALTQPLSVASLELKVRDALEEPELPDRERPTLEALSRVLKDARRSRRVEIGERTIIVLRSKRGWRL